MQIAAGVPLHLDGSEGFRSLRVSLSGFDKLRDIARLREVADRVFG